MCAHSGVDEARRPVPLYPGALVTGNPSVVHPSKALISKCQLMGKAQGLGAPMPGPVENLSHFPRSPTAFRIIARVDEPWRVCPGQEHHPNAPSKREPQRGFRIDSNTRFVFRTAAFLPSHPHSL